MKGVAKLLSADCCDCMETDIASSYSDTSQLVLGLFSIQLFLLVLLSVSHLPCLLGVIWSLLF